MTEEPFGVRAARACRDPRRRRLAALPALLLVAAGAAACSDTEVTDADEEPEALPATWRIPADVCERLDLVGIVTEVVTDPQIPPSAGVEDVEADRAGCSASAGSGMQITVDLSVSTDGARHASALARGQAQLDPPSVWSSVGSVEEVSVDDDVASWAGSAETAAYSVVALSSTDDLDDALYLNEVVVADDDNLVAVVTVSRTTPASQDGATEEAAAALAAAAAAVPEALEGSP